MLKKLLIFTLFSSSFLFGEKLINKIYPSPDNKNIIYYEGAERQGDGTFFYNANYKKIIILKEFLRYGPAVNWISKDIAEIKIATGSPDFHLYFFDFKNKRLSKSFDLAIVNDPVNQNVACLDLEKIIIYDMFTGKIKLKYKLEKLEPIGFLTFCEKEYKFTGNGNFYMKWKCPNEDNFKEINIKF